MSTNLKDISVIPHHDLDEIKPTGGKKRSKEQLRKLMKRMTNPHKVLDSPNIIGSKELLKLSYEMGDYPYPEKISLEEYENEKQLLQIELLKVQAWVKGSGERILGLFEGRDAAGKGGAIKRFMEHLNPRAAHVVALEKPTEDSVIARTPSRMRSMVRPGDMDWIARVKHTSPRHPLTTEERALFAGYRTTTTFYEHAGC